MKGKKTIIKEETIYKIPSQSTLLCVNKKYFTLESGVIEENGKQNGRVNYAIPEISKSFYFQEISSGNRGAYYKPVFV